MYELLHSFVETGKQVTFSVVHIDRVINGKIVEHWGQGDTLALMRQLGIEENSKHLKDNL